MHICLYLQNIILINGYEQLKHMKPTIVSQSQTKPQPNKFVKPPQYLRKYFRPYNQKKWKK